MKSIVLLTAALFVGVAGFAQGSSGVIVDISRSAQSSNRETLIWGEDFSEGLPGSWVAAEDGGVANWEYRGDNTTPNNEIGSRGSCTTNGAGAPIQSPTWTNGFMIFDSNYWDNEVNPCAPEYFGTGVAPGPHYATLTTPMFDLSGYTYVGLNFHQYYKKFEGTTRVEMSVGNGPWTIMYESDLVSGGETALDENTRIPLGNGAAGQSNVRLRFVFEGSYYFWMIDDVEVLQLDANDMALKTVTYGNYDLFAEEHPTGYEELEYGQYPNEMPPLLKFSGSAFNNGAIAQTDVRLHVKVENDETDAVLFDGSSLEGFVVYPATEQELRAGSFQMPGDIGKYRVVFEVTQVEADASVANSLDTLYFRITDVVLARDKGAVNAVYLTNPDYDARPYEMGNVVKVTTTGMEAVSISVAVGLGTSTPSTAYARIYEVLFDGGLTFTPVAVSGVLDVSPSDINEFNGEVLKTFVLNTPYQLSINKAYYVCVVSDNGGDEFVVGMNGRADDFTSFVRFPEVGPLASEYYNLSRYPIVRLNFGPWVGVEESGQLLGLSVYPNPVHDYITISPATQSTNDLTWSIYSASGQVVMTGRINQGEMNQQRIDLSSMSAGVYSIQMVDGNDIVTETFVKE
jgi:hypothetical protein